MIIFVYWYLSVQDISKDSNWKVVSSLIKNLPKDKYSWIVNYPSFKGVPFKPEEEFDNVVWYEVPSMKGRNKGVFVNNYRAVEQVANKYPVHLIWNNLVEITDILKQTFSEPLFEIPVVSTQHYVMHRSLGGLMWHKFIAFRQVLGSILSNANLFSSAYSAKMLEETIAELGVFDHVQLNGKHMPLMVIGDEFYRQGNRKGKIKLIYNHRLEAYKNYQSTFEKLNKLWISRKDFEMYVTYGESKRSYVDKFEWCKSVDLSKEEYFDLLHECDFGVLESYHETFCISAVEAMTAGVKMYLPDAVTFKEIADDRCVIFKDDFVEQLSKDMDNIVEIRKEKVSNDYIKRYSINSLRQKWIDLFDEMTSIPLNAKKDSIRRYLEVNDATGDYFDYREKVLKDLNIGSQALNNSKFAKWLYTSGYDINIVNNRFYISKL